MEDIKLGDKIRLVGFNGFSKQEMVIVRKMVGNYATKFMEREKFKELILHAKPVHEIDDNKKIEIKCRLICDKEYNSSAVDKNLFVCLDSVLKKVQNEAKS